MKLLYLELQQPLSEQHSEALGSWGLGGRDPDTLELLEEELEELLSTLRASTLLLPQSLAALEGRPLGFLPFSA